MKNLVLIFVGSLIGTAVFAQGGSFELGPMIGPNAEYCRPGGPASFSTGKEKQKFNCTCFKVCGKPQDPSDFPTRVEGTNCRKGDRQTSIERAGTGLDCTTYGTCFAYGRNPSTDQDEVYWGEHNNCQGKRVAPITIRNCKTPSGKEYYTRTVGAYGACKIK